MFIQFKFLAKELDGLLALACRIRGGVVVIATHPSTKENLALFQFNILDKEDVNFVCS